MLPCSADSISTSPSRYGAFSRGTKIEELYTQLYIHLALDLRNNSQATGLLRRPPAQHRRSMLAPFLELPRMSLGTARFIYLDNTPNIMALVPSRHDGCLA